MNENRKDNMTVYERFRSVPKEAQKTIQAGKLKGFTDINPMWRIKMLTEQFGPCGMGWKTSDVNMWTETCAGETAAFCSLNLYYKDNGEWSGPVFGIGGSKLAGKGVGDGINDEAFKMAYTDAISIACKNLGMAADIYFDKDRTKYDMGSAQSTPAPKPAPAPVAPLKDKTYLEINDANWNKAVEYLFTIGKKSGKRGSLEMLLTNFSMSEETYQALKDLDETAEKMQKTDTQANQ